MTKIPPTTSNDSKDEEASSTDEELVEGVDYTIDPETGLLVFTSHYLLKRGYCCQSGCRHCPYGFNKTKDKT